MYAHMALEVLVQKTQAANPQLGIPADQLRAYLSGFPPNAMEMARDKWVSDFQRSRLQTRAQSRVDQMGPAGTSPSIPWDKYSGEELISLSLEKMARR
jgi:hypothetical protein